MIYKDKTNFTSPEFAVNMHSSLAFCVSITGPGPVAIEMLQEDGEWRSFPETKFDGPTIQVVDLFRGQYRVAISGGPTTVEVRA